MILYDAYDDWFSFGLAKDLGWMFFYAIHNTKDLTWNLIETSKKIFL